MSLTDQLPEVVGGRLLDLAEGLNTKLKDGDTLLFVPAFAGGR